MSVHLLPLTTPIHESIQYINPAIVGTVNTAFAIEYNRKIYMGININSLTFDVQSFNLFNRQVTSVASISKTLFNNNKIGGMLIDGDIIYLRNTSDKFIYAYDTTTRTMTKYTQSERDNSAYGKIKADRLKNNLIWFCCTKGYGTFDKNTSVFEYYGDTSVTTLNSYDFEVGVDIVVSSFNGVSYNAIRVLDINSNEISSVTLGGSDYCSICYNAEHKLFYFVQKTLITVYDETSKTILKTIPISIPNTVCSARYDNDIIYITASESNILYWYNLATNTMSNLYLSYKLPKCIGTTRVAICPTTFKGYYFLPYNNLNMLYLKSDAKYRLGIKRKNEIVICNSDHEASFDYDKNYGAVEFGDTYIAINDSVITVGMTATEEDPFIKKVKINKSDYNVLKSLNVRHADSD